MRSNRSFFAPGRSVLRSLPFVSRGLFVLFFFLLAYGAIAVAEVKPAPRPLVVGSKNFTEGVVLGELVRALASTAGPADHRQALGGTRLVFNALASGEIDVYAEYTGTLTHEILAKQKPGSLEEIRAILDKSGLLTSESLGFKDNFALGMRRDLAERLNIRRISDLRAHPELVFRFGTEFMERGDGWPGLREHYGLPQEDVLGIEHDLAYRGLAAGEVELTDLYTTDAEIAYYDLLTLEDDLNYFPPYEALLLYRAELAETHPAALEAMLRLQGEISEAEMVSMNARVKLGRVQENVVAADFLRESLGVEIHARETRRVDRFFRYTGQHLALVASSLSFAILIAVPLGVAAARRPRLAQVILGVVGVAQTIPALALLVFMIPLFGIGAGPAVVALFLYSLLPIVRNTHTGLMGIPLPLRESAEALGLPSGARLRLIEGPLAAPSILAGIKTAAVINVGAATLGALVGAGGYGQPILTGIRLDDMGLILEGAVPAALLALCVQWLFEWAERAVIPAGLRTRSRV
ncbi:MAG: amino acid ABC transporter permease [Deltaproteobacteria bacterium]|nr:amino acid ABC transporter permease [Deltaproteobacteria bacterium]